MTVIGLVLHTRYSQAVEGDEHENDQGSRSEEESDGDDDVKRGYKKSYKFQGGTLIVCPASLINQWEHEIKNHVKRRKLTVLMHHGKRTESAHALCKADVVITTYGIISSDHKSQVSKRTESVGISRQRLNFRLIRLVSPSHAGCSIPRALGTHCAR